MNDADNRQALADAELAHTALGGRLAETRKAQNLSTADVARQLKLSVWQVEALETGRYQRLPGPIFVRGFIRNYARLVKLDPNELLRAAGDSLPQTVMRSEMPPSQDIPFPNDSRARWPVPAAAAVIIVGVLAIYEFYWNEPGVPVTPAVAVSPVPAVKPEKSDGVQADPQPSIETRAAQSDVTPATAKQTTQEGSPANAAGAQTNRLPGPGEKQLRLVFDEESWVEIRDRDERIIFSQLNRPGTRRSVSGVPPFSIVIGNSHGVRMSYDDKSVDLARHTKIDVARLILQ